MDRSIKLSEPATAALQSLAQRQGLTLGALIQGAWALLLSRYSGAQDVVFGACAPLSAREEGLDEGLTTAERSCRAAESAFQ